MDSLHRLIVIAIVSKDFCQKLLQNPELALAEGYENEPIKLTLKDKAILLNHNAKTLEELAEYFLNQTLLLPKKEQDGTLLRKRPTKALCFGRAEGNISDD